MEEGQTAVGQDRQAQEDCEGVLSRGAARETRANSRCEDVVKMRLLQTDANFPALLSPSFPLSLSLFTLSDQYSLCVGGRCGAGTLAAEGGFQWPFRHPDALARGCQSLGC